MLLIFIQIDKAFAELNVVILGITSNVVSNEKCTIRIHFFHIPISFTRRFKSSVISCGVYTA